MPDSEQRTLFLHLPTKGMQKELPVIHPVSPKPRTHAFDDPEWLFEIKYDGFRGLAQMVDNECRLVGRSLSRLHGFRQLEAVICAEVHARDAVLDGEIVSLDEHGRVDFNALLDRKGHFAYFAYDLLLLNGADLRHLPLIERKKKLARIMPEKSTRIFLADYVEEHGKALFEMVRKNDLEGVIAKRGSDPYDAKKTIWYKIKNPRYTQKEGRNELSIWEGRKVRKF